MVQLLGSALDLPLEERNALHVAAGFVPLMATGLAADNCSMCQAFDFIFGSKSHTPGSLSMTLGCPHSQ